MYTWLKKLGNRNRHWGEWNYRFGPFTLSNTHNAFCAKLVGYNHEDDYNSHVFLALFGKALLIEMPNWIAPKSVVIFDTYSEMRIQEFGISYSSEIGISLRWGVHKKFVPIPWIRDFWYNVYVRMCEALHCWPETKEQMNDRLGDNMEGWKAREDKAGGCST